MIRRLTWALALLVCVVALGTVGYALIEHWSVLDSLYMTVITVATVGFSEVHPLGAAGKVFTIALVLAGVGTLGFALGNLVDFLVEGHLTNILEVRTMGRRLEALENHTILTGLGRVGLVVARELAEEGRAFVIVDVTPESAETARSENWLFVQGDATDENVLVEAGIKRAESIVTALSGDAENLFVTVSARALNPNVFIVARSSHESTEAKLISAGANRVITPNVIGGRRMAAMVLHPMVADYLDLVTGNATVGFRLQEVELSESSSYVGQTIADARIRDTTGAQVVAILSPDGTVNASPGGHVMLKAGQKLIVLGSADQVAVLAERACML